MQVGKIALLPKNIVLSDSKVRKCNVINPSLLVTFSSDEPAK